MIRNALIILCLLFLAFMAGAIAAFYYFGWLGLLSVLVGLFVVFWLVKRFFLRILMWIMRRPFKRRARVLRGAKIEVHRITPAEEPPDAEEFDPFDSFTDSFAAAGPDGRPAIGGQHEAEAARDAEAAENEEFQLPPYYEGPRDFYYVDLTITPRQSNDSEACWNPAALTVLPPADARDTQQVGQPLAPSLPFNFDGSCEVYELCFWRNGQFQEYDEVDDHEQIGSQRIQLHIGVRRDIQKLNLLYYFELLGQIELGTILDM